MNWWRALRSLVSGDDDEHTEDEERLNTEMATSRVTVDHLKRIAELDRARIAAAEAELRAEGLIRGER